MLYVSFCESFNVLFRAMNFLKKVIFIIKTFKKNLICKNLFFKNFNMFFRAVNFFEKVFLCIREIKKDSRRVSS